MRNWRRKLLAFIVMLVLAVAFGAVSAHAASRKIIMGTQYEEFDPDGEYHVLCYYFPGKQLQYTLWLKGLCPISREKITNSDKSVATAVKGHGEAQPLWVTVKKAGKTTITVRYIPEGKTEYKTTKINVTVKKWKTPLSKLKLGKIDLTTSMNSPVDSYKKMKFPAGNAMINIRLKKGWALKRIEFLGEKAVAGRSYPDYVYKSPKNHTKFDFRGVTWTEMVLELRNKTYGFDLQFNYKVPSTR